MEAAQPWHDITALFRRACNGTVLRCILGAVFFLVGVAAGAWASDDLQIVGWALRKVVVISVESVFHPWGIPLLLLAGVTIWFVVRINLRWWWMSVVAVISFANTYATLETGGPVLLWPMEVQENSQLIEK